IMERPDGTRRHVLAHPKPLHDSSGQPAGALNILVDITDRKIAEQAVRHSEARYRQVVDALPVAMYVCDADAKVTFFNDAAAELWGRRPELGKEKWCGSFRMRHTDGRPMPLAECSMADVIREGRAYAAGVEAVVERPDGSLRNIIAHPQPIRDHHGKVTGAINIVVDITAGKLAQEALQRTEAQLETELADTKLLQAISAQLIHEENVESLYERILDAAVAIMRSEYASMQMLYPERGSGGELRLLAFRGFNPEAAKFWQWVRADSESTCGAALRTGRRVVAPDVGKCDFMAGTDDLATYLQTGIHAVQTTPLWSRSGKMVGMISTHWRSPHQPSERDLRLLDILARQAADLIERNLAGEAQARLAAIVQSSDDAIISKDLNGIIISWNSAAERIFGYTAAEAIGKHIALIVPPELHEEEQGILKRLRRGEPLEHYETVRVARDGRRIHVSLTISPMRDASGHVVGASKVAREIGDRKQADAMMAGQKEALEFAISGAPINDVLEVLAHTARAQSEGVARSAIFIVDTDGAHLRFAAAAGMPKTYTSAVDGFNIGPEFPSCGLAAYSGRPVIVRDVAQDPLWAPFLDLAQRHQICACWSFPILSRGGKVLGTFAVYHDHPRDPHSRDLQSIGLLTQTAAVLIERHNHAEQREYAAESLRESEARFRYLADNAPVLIWVNGLEGCEFVNREYLRFLGCTFNDVLDMEWSRFIHPDDVEGYLAAYLRAFQRREPFDAQLRFRRADGEYRWMHAVGAPRFTPGGAFVGYVGCSVDITEVKRSEEDLKQADQRKDEFLAMLGHELRNPLAAVSTGAALLKQNPTEERRAWIEQMMSRQIELLRRLVDDLLDVTRITRGKIQLRKQQLDLKKHIEAAVEAVSPLIQKRRHDFSVSWPEEVAFLYADPARFEQILVNLLTNAVKYTPERGKIHLSAEVVACHSEDAPCLPPQGGQAAAEESQPQFSREYQPVAQPTANRQSEATHPEFCPTSTASQSPHRHVVIRCRDTGAGITPAALERIFEPFVQFHAALDRSDSGLGVGLALVKRLTEMHGGTVTAASEGPGQGSEFTLRLPLLALEDVRLSQPVPEIMETLASEDALRVLVVDDNLDYAEGIAILLRSAGHNVTLADNGQAAMAAALREPPDIILLDLGLPGLDGYAVAERLRSPDVSEQMKGTTIVAVSGFSPKNAAKGRPNFFDAQLVKPIAHADLLGLLQEKLAARKAAVSPPLPFHRILLVEDNQ
ncbi:MAG: PAS domain S-box protein, partial [Candidatus Acidiferrales bacterium]